MTGTLHLIFKTHLDLGFTGRASQVRAQYHDHFIPMALDTGEHFRAEGGRDFIWTTGSWLIWDHLETQSAEKVRRLERAIADGLIRWHALPFTTHTELMSPRLFREGIGIARELDRRFGLTTRAAKMTDVPGHTLGAVKIMAEEGIEFLHLGVNSASPVPDVPPVFHWQAPSGASVVVMYQPSYGALQRVDGVPDAIAFAHTNDNTGPQGITQVIEHHREAERIAPDLTVRAASLDDYWSSLKPHAARLPVVTQEIGDTWIHGTASAPTRIRRFLAAQRAFDGWDAVTPARRAFARKLMEVPEHTWGVDIKIFLRDEAAFDRTAFEEARRTNPRFAITEAAWAEQDRIVDEALAHLTPEDRAACVPVPAPAISGQAAALTDQAVIGPFTLSFDPATGAVRSLRHHGKPLLTARPDSPGLFAFSQQSFDAADLFASVDSYLTARPDWAWRDHLKPGFENAQTAQTASFLTQDPHLIRDTTALHVTASMPPDAVRDFGAPPTVMTTYAADGDTLTVTLTLHGKAANRQPEAGFWHVEPLLAPGTLRLTKMGLTHDPRDVVTGGNRQLHSVASMTFDSTEGAELTLTPLDAPLFQLSSQPFLAFTKASPDPDQGGRFVLFNNKWGTNFSMWSEGDMTFRIRLSVGQT
jgi:hypothetical protein